MQSSMVAVGALMTAVVVGGTAGASLAAARETPDSAPVVVRPSSQVPSQPAIQEAVYTVFTWPTPSATPKSTAVRVTDPDQGVVRRSGTATRIAVVWAVAATLATAGVLGGSLLRRGR